jgi:hypothetical protein
MPPGRRADISAGFPQLRPLTGLGGQSQPTIYPAIITAKIKLAMSLLSIRKTTEGCLRRLPRASPLLPSSSVHRSTLWSHRRPTPAAVSESPAGTIPFPYR